MLSKLYSRLAIRRAATIAVAQYHIETQNRTAYLQDKAEYQAIQTTLDDEAFNETRKIFSFVDVDGIFPEWPDEELPADTVAIRDIEAVANFIDYKARFDVAIAECAIFANDKYEYESAHTEWEEKRQLLNRPIFAKYGYTKTAVSGTFPTWEE